MSEPKHKFSISMDAELVDRLDAICEARDESRSSAIERMVRNEVPSEEKFVTGLESPIQQAIARIIVEQPRVVQTLAALVGEHMTDEEAAKLKKGLEKQVSRANERRQTKRSKKTREAYE